MLLDAGLRAPRYDEAEDPPPVAALPAVGEGASWEVLAPLLAPAALAGLAGPAEGVPAPLWERALAAPVRELLVRPGKGFRGRLTAIAYRLGGGEGAPPPALAAMLEVIHAGSMIVDDIEDDSAERRGGPAVHRQFGLPLALNAGNWMYFAPLALLDQLGLAPAAELHLRRRLGRVLLDCHYGQALDLGALVRDVPPSRLADLTGTISTLKTGRLLAFAAEVGALAAGAPPVLAGAIARFGEALGVGLQMLDDLGNLSGRASPEKRYEDLAQGRVTWVWAWAAARLAPPRFHELVVRADRLRARGLSVGQPAEEAGGGIRAAEAQPGARPPDAASGRTAPQRTRLEPGAQDAPWSSSRFEPLARQLRALVGGVGRQHAHRHLATALSALRAALLPEPGPGRAPAASVSSVAPVTTAPPGAALAGPLPPALAARRESALAALAAEIARLEASFA